MYMWYEAYANQIKNTRVYIFLVFNMFKGFKCGHQKNSIFAKNY